LAEGRAYPPDEELQELLADDSGSTIDAEADDTDDWIEDSFVAPAGTVEGFSAASFDVISVVSLLNPVEPPSEFEIHTFLYLGCLLYLFDGHPASSWGYSFSAVPPTVPFSTTLSMTIDQLVSSGLLGRIDDASEATSSVGGGDTLEEEMYALPSKYRLTEDGRQELKFLSSLHTLQERAKYLEAAASTSLVYSVPAVINSLVHEPQLWQAVRTQVPRSLLAAITSRPLYEQFEALRDAIGGEVRHLSIPATVYVGYLEQQAQDDFKLAERTGEVEQAEDE
jgi:hypothetical protein